jgi:hypothetical protein
MKKILQLFLIICSISASYAQNIGINNLNPKYPLTFNVGLGDKISLWNDPMIPSLTPDHYGLGVQSGRLQIYTPTINDDIVFGTGRSGLFTERLRFTGDGNLGIGTNNPTNKLEVLGPTLLNGTASITGNTGISGDLILSKGVQIGNTTNIANGTLRLNDSNDNKLEYRENGAWYSLTNEYYSSPNPGFVSAVRNQLVINPTFEYTVPATGYYMATIQANTFPVYKTNGCTIQYLDNGAGVWLYSKTRAVQFFAAGSFKWFLVTGQTGCTSSTSIPTRPSANKIVYLQKDEKLTFAYQFDMTTVPAGTLDSWSADAQMTLLKVGN